MSEKYNITGMTCSACSTHVTKAIEKLEGTQNVTVNLLTNSLTLDYDKDKLSEKDIIEAVEKAGYGASSSKVQKKESKESSSKQIAEKEKNELKQRFTVSLIFAVPLVYIAMGSMLNWPMPSIMMGHKNAITFIFTQFLLLIPIVYVNKSYFIRGFKSLANKAPNMDSLIAIGASAAIIYGIFAIYMIGYGLGIQNMDIVKTYHMDVYFESAGVILTLITLG